MARCPFATWNPRGTTPGQKINPRVAILHVTDGEGNASPHHGLEWHFEIFYDGRIEQQVDTDYRADANLKANAFAISIETEGLGPDPWTPEQLDAILRLLRWLNDVHDIPLTRCDAWDGSGIGHHTMWGSPSNWTPVAKSCPGPRRKVQFDNYILPHLARPTPTPEDDMTNEQAQQLAQAHEWLRRLSFGFDSGTGTPFSERAELTSRIRRIEAKIDTLAVAAGIDPAALGKAVAEALAKELTD